MQRTTNFRAGNNQVIFLVRSLIELTHQIRLTSSCVALFRFIIWDCKPSFYFVLSRLSPSSHRLRTRKIGDKRFAFLICCCLIFCFISLLLQADVFRFRWSNVLSRSRYLIRSFIFINNSSFALKINVPAKTPRYLI